MWKSVKASVCWTGWFAGTIPTGEPVELNELLTDSCPCSAPGCSLLFTRHLNSYLAIYPHISSVTPSAGSGSVKAALLLLSNLRLTLGLCWSGSNIESLKAPFIFFSFQLNSGTSIKARNSFHLFPQCQLKGWNFHHPTFSLLDVSAGIRWILREELIFGDAVSQLPHHIPFSMLFQASGCAARAAFTLYLLKCFIHLDMQRPHECPK